MGQVKVSPVRPIPCTMQGKIIGKGVPGLIWSEDFVIQDPTGILFLDYNSGFSLFNWWFALARVPGLLGQQVEAIGWYRRGPAPYFELKRVRYAGGTRSSWMLPMKLFWSALCVLGGIVLAVAMFSGVR